MDGLLGIVVLLLLVVLYFLPTVIANSRGHHNTGGIFLLNFLIGWTAIGWIVALVMACGEVKEKPASAAYARCGQCNARVGMNASSCQKCGHVFAT